MKAPTAACACAIDAIGINAIDLEDYRLRASQICIENPLSG
jgi:hypothetical protein